LTLAAIQIATIIKMKFFKIPHAIAFFSIFILTACHSTKLNCKSVKNGTFHVYTSDGQHFLIIRKDTTDAEVNLATGDTSFWKVKWISDCDFISQYISGGRMESKEQEEFFKKTVAQFSIQKVTPLYYIFTGTVKTPKGDRTYTDTTWRKE
jgi:hypothetical protein